MTVRKLGAGRHERLEDLSGPVWMAAVRRPPDCRFAHAAVPGPDRGLSLTLEQQPHDLEVIAEDCVEQRRFTIAGMRVDRYALVERIPGNLELPVSRRISQGTL